MKNIKEFTILIILFAFLFGCDTFIGEEVARIHINSISSDDTLIVKETSILLQKGERVSFWSDMDIEYEGDIYLLFQVRIYKDDIEYGGLEIDPTKKSITIGEFKTSLMNKTKWKFTGKNTTIGIPEDGKYTFKAHLISNHNESLKVNKAEIILKI